MKNFQSCGVNVYKIVDYFRFQNSIIKQMYLYKYLFRYYVNIFRSFVGYTYYN